MLKKSKNFEEEEKELTPKQWRKGLRIIAENAVNLKEGDRVGRWDREGRIAVVYSVLCAFARKQGVKI